MAEQNAPRRVVRMKIESDVAQPGPEKASADQSRQTPRPSVAAAPKPAVTPTAPAAKPTPVQAPTYTPKAKVATSIANDAEAKSAGEPKRSQAPASQAQVDAVPATDAPVVDVPADDSASPSAQTGPARARASVADWVRRTFPGHEHAFWGGVVALLVALLVFVIGLWRVLFIGMVILVGVAVGQVLDGDPKLVNAIRDLFDSERGQR